jgi:hypothetical protein
VSTSIVPPAAARTHTSDIPAASTPAAGDLVGERPSQPVPLVPSATISVLASAALALGCVVGLTATIAVVAVEQLALLLCWSAGSTVAGRRGALLLGVVAAAAADVAAVHWYEHGYESALAVLGLAVVSMFIHQLIRRAPRTGVVQSLSGVAVTVLAVCAVTGLLLLRRDDEGGTVTAGLAAATGAGLLVSHIVDAIVPRPRFDPAVDRGLLGVVLGALSAAGVGLWVLHPVTGLTQPKAGVVGLGVGVVACLLSVGASFAAVDGTATSSVENATPASTTHRQLRLRSATAVLWVLFVSVPVGYVLVNALSQ